MSFFEHKLFAPLSLYIDFIALNTSCRILCLFGSSDIHPNESYFLFLDTVTE